MEKKELTVEFLKTEASIFARRESNYHGHELYGATDGKAVGTYLEHKLMHHLNENYIFDKGNSAQGIDFPKLGVDIKVTSIHQPQSSCPYKSARQKVFGLGYSLLLFVYEKKDDIQTKTTHLNILHTIFIESHRTADYQLTRILNEIKERSGNTDDLAACLLDRHLPIDEDEAYQMAQEISETTIQQGYLTISNALQWRLQYKRVVDSAGEVEGVIRL